ncbi:MAG: AraC family transcriptional regulator [Candidatus Eremiobacterota bacterium]
MNKSQLCWTWSKIRHKKINDKDEKEPGYPYIDKTNRIIGLKFFDSSYPVNRGTLFIKCVLNGMETFETEKGTFPVEKNHYLILNDECKYTSRINPSHDVESFCISFVKPFVEDVARSIMVPGEKLLDEPERSSVYPAFNEKLYSQDDIITELIQNLKCTSDCENNLTQAYLEELFYKLLERILILNLDKKTEGISTLKKVPRIEILERLNLAREFMHSNIDRPINLSQIASNAYLSTYHFLRLFKEVFGETPRQYLIRNRLERARKLLLHTELSVTDISLEIGFESISHFTRLFNRRFGSSPGKFRQSLQSR